MSLKPVAWENEGLHISNARNDQLFPKLKTQKKTVLTDKLDYNKQTILSVEQEFGEK